MLTKRIITQFKTIAGNNITACFILSMILFFVKFNACVISVLCVDPLRNSTLNQNTNTRKSSNSKQMTTEGATPLINAADNCHAYNSSYVLKYFESSM